MHNRLGAQSQPHASPPPSPLLRLPCVTVKQARCCCSAASERMPSCTRQVLPPAVASRRARWLSSNSIGAWVASSNTTDPDAASSAIDSSPGQRGVEHSRRACVRWGLGPGSEWRLTFALLLMHSRQKQSEHGGELAVTIAPLLHQQPAQASPLC